MESSLISKEIDAHQQVLDLVKNHLQHKIFQAYLLIRNTLLDGNKVIFCGNGGSAAEAQHLAAEFTGRFRRERKPLPALALTTDTSALTAIGNDYSFDRIFSRQLEALAVPGDLLYAISTSGNSLNIINAITEANRQGCRTIGLSGRDGGKMKALCGLNLLVPVEDTARIQEMHLLIGHVICRLIDETEALR